MLSSDNRALNPNPERFWVSKACVCAPAPGAAIGAEEDHLHHLSLLYFMLALSASARCSTGSSFFGFLRSMYRTNSSSSLKSILGVLFFSSPRGEQIERKRGSGGM